MNRLVLAVALLLSLPFAARADDASHRAKAEELIALLHSDQVATQLINEVLRQTTEITTKRSAGKMTPETQAALADFQKKVVSVLEPQIGWKAIEPGYVQLYTDTFSEEDLDHMMGGEPAVLH